MARLTRSLDSDTAFCRDLARLINRHSLENDSGTPDFVLAEFLEACLLALTRAAGARDRWYGSGRQNHANGRAGLPVTAAPDTRAATGYNAYRESTGGVSAITGEPLPDLSGCPASVQRAWRAAAGAIEQAVIEELTGYTEDPGPGPGGCGETPE